MKVEERPNRPSKLRQWFPAEVEPGTKAWYRSKRTEHIALWFLPLVPVGYTLSSQGASMPWGILVTMLAPVVASGVALAFVSHALWRVEINVAGNREHPFTDKDQKALRRSNWMLVLSLVFGLAVSNVASLILGPDGEHMRAIRTGANTAFIVGFVGAAIVATMSRIHCKAKYAYEELGKGV